MINDTIDVLRQQYALQQQSSAVTDEQSQAFKQTVATAQDLRDKIANFDDFFRPLRNYFYWEPHCFDIPICWALRSLFDALDGINVLGLNIPLGVEQSEPLKLHGQVDFGFVFGLDDSGNFYAQNNVALTPANFSSYCITTPVDSRHRSTSNSTAGGTV